MRFVNVCLVGARHLTVFQLETGPLIFNELQLAVVMCNSRQVCRIKTDLGRDLARFFFKIKPLSRNSSNTGRSVLSNKFTSVGNTVPMACTRAAAQGTLCAEM